MSIEVQELYNFINESVKHENTADDLKGKFQIQYNGKTKFICESKKVAEERILRIQPQPLSEALKNGWSILHESVETVVSPRDTGKDIKEGEETSSECCKDCGKMVKEGMTGDEYCAGGHQKTVEKKEEVAKEVKADEGKVSPLGQELSDEERIKTLMEAEEAKYTVIGMSITDKRMADEMALKNKGSVVIADKDDATKWMVILPEETNEKKVVEDIGDDKPNAEGETPIVGEEGAVAELTDEQILEVGTKVGGEGFEAVDKSEFTFGFREELECLGDTVDHETLAKVVLSHLEKFPAYYTKVEQMISDEEGDGSETSDITDDDMAFASEEETAEFEAGPSDEAKSITKGELVQFEKVAEGKTGLSNVFEVFAVKELNVYFRPLKEGKEKKLKKEEFLARMNSGKIKKSKKKSK